MEITVARKRLEEMRADLDRTVSVLMGEHHLVRGGGAEAGDAGSNLTEADRTPRRCRRRWRSALR
jgi:hypothetical protein